MKGRICLDPKQQNQEIVGFIEQDEHYAVFTEYEHHFTFIPEIHANHLHGDIKTKSQVSLLLNSFYQHVYQEMTLKAQNRFLKGQLYKGKSVLIYMRRDLKLSPIRHLNTWLYIVSKGVYDIDGCDGIRFKSDILTSLFFQNSVECTYDDKEQNKRSIRFKDDSIRVPIEDSVVKELSIYSNVSENILLKMALRSATIGLC